MQKIFTMLMLLALTSGMVAIAAGAMAQTKSGIKHGSSAGAASGMAGKPITPEAPVGHRQPRAGDVPSNAEDPMHADDAALDKQIKSICRGC